MVISGLLKKAQERLLENGIENARFEAMHIISFALNIPVSELILNSNTEVADADLDAVFELIKRRISGEPFQYILGTQEFMGLSFFVSPDTLIPRQDTETLVEFILDRFPDAPISILDIGTGTGCIPISLLNFRKDFTATGIDISVSSLMIAKKNAENLAVSDRISLEKCDILTEIPNGQFDIIVSNPPYIKSGIIPTLQTEVRDFEPILALDGGDDGLSFYRRICEIAPKILKNGGLLAFEIGFDQADDVTGLMSGTFKNIEVTKDLALCDRVVSGILR